jgi:GST-like protein
MIELYGCGSPNVRKVVIMLEELRLSYTFHYTDIMRGQSHTPQFLAMNPLGRVPVLIDREGPAGSEPIFESGAILIYLAEAYQGAEFLPRQGGARYATIKWLMLQMANVGPMFGQHNHFTVTSENSQSYAAKRYRDQASRLYHVLNDRLAQAPWLAGADYSIADIATYPWAVYVENHGFDWVDLPHLAEWRSRMEERPAIAKAKIKMQGFIDNDTISSKKVTQKELNELFWLEGDEGPSVDLTRLYPNRGRQLQN